LTLNARHQIGALGHGVLLIAPVALQRSEVDGALYTFRSGSYDVHA
jgi:hypothetical protein